MKREDVDRAVGYAEFNRKTHVQWACYYNRHPEEQLTYSESAGDRSHQIQYIREYNHIIAVLRAARSLVKR